MTPSKQSVIHCVYMMDHEDKLGVWVNAYNVALAALLSSRTTRPTPGDVGVIGGQCSAIADQALLDAASRDAREPQQ